MIKKALFLLTSSMFLSACSTLSGPNWWHSEHQENQNGAHRQAPSQQTQDNPLGSLGQQQVTDQMTADLVKMGQIALAENRLLRPDGDNANLYFQVALGRDPGNYDATLGIAAIVERYLAWAVNAAKRQDLVSARRYLASAKQVNPRDPLITEVEQQIQQIQVQSKRLKLTAEAQPMASENLFNLSDNLFQLGEEKILAQIQPIIERVGLTKGSLEIYWPNDKEGRLLYQIINSRTPDFRVRAMTFQSSRHVIEVKVN
ncbi:hypothetical protein MAQ5080_00527 [Marinomonas aquimarina]|uniref:Lipoprotein n=2 Tax=Marinomonas aquimarina TaxID=295068 RepID=A0A1A8T4M5_9GAMM|nr:hypothetical protein [Marinomonas aquimarina]SBS26465.1 hypothetical protein MAQ5080_00527 [Marinomonas aquimarina]